MGVDAFFIADNESKDGSRELLEALAEAGYIRLMSFPTRDGQPPQMRAYAALMEAHAHEVDWVAFIDADEFLVPTDGSNDIRAAFDRLAKQPDVGAIAVNWAIFGSAGRIAYEPGLVLERFACRAPREFLTNCHYKSIVRCAAYESVEGNPHFFRIRADWSYVHSDCSRLVDHPERGKGLSAAVCWNGLRLNHYAVKSREEFEQRKAPKGSASLAGRRKGSGYFANHDCNEVRDPLPDAMLAEVATEAERIRSALKDIGATLTERPIVPSMPRPLFDGVRGHVDTIEQRDGALVIRGWALRASGRPPSTLVVDIEGKRTTFNDHAHIQRPDVQRHYPAAEPTCGFVLIVPDAPRSEETRYPLSIIVFAGDTPADEAMPLIMPALVCGTPSR